MTEAPLEVGDEVELRIGKAVHGGHCLAHLPGRTIFVRHALPGELVTARITECSRRMVRADAVRVIEAAEGRVPPACPHSGPDGCGGCDFSHVAPSVQRSWKSEILRESLQRFGGVTDEAMAALDTRVHELPGHRDGLGWRTRIDFARGDDGRWGLRAAREHRIIAVDTCPLGTAEACAAGPPRPAFTARVRERSWKVRPEMFWQAHEALPEALVDACLEFGAPAPGESWWDLYSGAGLIAAFVAEAVGPAGRVDAVELSMDASKAARRSLHDLPHAHLHQADVRPWLAARLADGSATREGPMGAAVAGVVLDPPRKGAGATVLGHLVAARPARIVYVACDPVSLARDCALLAEEGYELTRLRSFDAFPMTSHFETVALFTPSGPARRQ